MGRKREQENLQALNPTTGQVITTLAEGTREDARRAIDAANTARAQIAGLSTWDRSRLCVCIAEVMELVSAVFTRSLKTAFYFAERLRTGIVNVNEHSNYWESHIPFGGVSGTHSGIGRIGGEHSLMEMTDLRTICIDISR